MSIRIMADVFRLQLAPNKKLVLLALANYANDRGFCWPTQSALAMDSTLSERRLRDNVHALAAEGWLTIVSVGNGRGKSSEYLLNLGRIRDEQPELKADVSSPMSTFSEKAEKADAESVKADVGDHKGGRSTSDQPSISNHQIQPSVVAPAKQEDLASPLPKRPLLTADLERIREKNRDLDVDGELLKFRNTPRKRAPMDQVRAFENWLLNTRKFAAERGAGSNAMGARSTGQREVLVDDVPYFLQPEYAAKVAAERAAEEAAAQQ